jgi:hypothetical protein
MEKLKIERDGKMRVKEGNEGLERWLKGQDEG